MLINSLKQETTQVDKRKIVDKYNGFIQTIEYHTTMGVINYSNNMNESPMLSKMDKNMH